MKFAAFISIIISVAVMFVACQGAVGPKGPQGDPGTEGTPGRDAFVPLTLKPIGPMVVITDGTDDDAMTVPGAATTIDLADYVRGTADRTYGKPSSDIEVAANRVFDAVLVGSMLTITPKETQPAQDDDKYAVETFTVTISDGGETADKDLMIPARRNRKPANAADVDGLVGTQAPETAPDSAPACSAINNTVANECYVDVIFTDPDAANNNDVEEKLTFTATSADTSKVDVVSVGTAAPATPLVARLVVKGVASTQVKDTDPGQEGDQAGHTGVVVTVIAMDQGRATAKGKATISVDGAPQADGTIPNRNVKISSAEQTVLTNVAGFFKDLEAETLTFVPMADDSKVVSTISIEENSETTLQELKLITNATGPTVITITATEATSQTNRPQQSVKQTFTLTVTE
jgi:hypothetical protein